MEQLMQRLLAAFPEAVVRSPKPGLYDIEVEGRLNYTFYGAVRDGKYRVTSVLCTNGDEFLPDTEVARIIRELR